MAANQTDAAHARPEAYDGWRLGVQTWTFKEFTLFEAIDKTRSLGLNGIQAYPGQIVSADLAVKFGPGLTAAQRQAVKDKLRAAGVAVYAFGVVGISGNDVEADALFAFAQDMGIETLACEPDPGQLEQIDRLCRKYGIKVALHNHPTPSRYWNPETVLGVCRGRSHWIGACADVGHWVRSGLDPVDCLKKLEGRIHDVHIKEIDNGHDVVWGTGQGRIQGILEELHRQGYRGTFSIEYEYHWDNNVPEIRESVAHFNAVAQSLAPGGWTCLIAPDLSNMDAPAGNWQFQDGALTLEPLKKGSDLWTKATYANFVLDLEFKLTPGANSGVFLRTHDHRWLPWIEVQVVDSYGKAPDRHTVGGLYDIQAPAVNAVTPAGQWNRLTITADGPFIDVVLNHQPVVRINLDDWTEAGKNPDGSKNKFDIAYRALPRAGFIGLQDHGDRVWYRNIKIKEL